jgi:hypothetical protein
MNDTAPYKFYSDSDSKRRLYPRRDHLDEYIEFDRPQYWTGSAWSNLVVGTSARSGNTLTWDRPSFSIRVFLTGDGIGKRIILKNSNAARRIRWPITLVGLVWNNWQLTSATEGIPVANIYKPWIVDANGTKGTITCDYVNGAVEFTADVTGLVYPITIDPTADVTVTASGDDSEQVSYGDCFPAELYLGLLKTNGYTYWGMRWPLAIDQGSIITVAYASVYTYSGSSDDPDANIYCQDVDTAGVFTTTAYEISNRARTVDYVIWTASDVGAGMYVNTPSLVVPIQAVFNRSGWSSGNYLALIWEARGTTQAISAYQYDTGPGTAPPKIHIEYTPGGSKVLYAKYSKFPKFIMRR